MIRERITDDIYVFTSRKYAQETAGAILTPGGVILIDTLFYPDETRTIKSFLEERLRQDVKYLINTHYHADHTQGTYLFPEACVVSHERCHQLLDTVGREGLRQAQSQDPELAEVEIVLPEMTFSSGELDLQLGGTRLRLFHMPGHSPDVIGVLLLDSGVFFASDNVMPVPTLIDGSYNDLYYSLRRMMTMELDMIVQGHGEIVLRGEVAKVLQASLDYLETIRDKVSHLVAQGQPVEALHRITIESCGRSRIPLNGLVSHLHQANLRCLYEEMTSVGGKQSSAVRQR